MTTVSRVLVRGGGSGFHADSCRSACRGLYPYPLIYISRCIGFRVVCLPREVKPATQIAVRGNTWLDDSVCGCRSVYRDWREPTVTASTVGFRVVCLPQEVKPPRMVVRGCSWFSLSQYGYSAFRRHRACHSNSGHVGFRVVCLPREVAP